MAKGFTTTPDPDSRIGEMPRSAKGRTSTPGDSKMNPKSTPGFSQKGKVRGGKMGGMGGRKGC